MARFIINRRVVKGPEALTLLRKINGETLKEYLSSYWEVYQEAEDCDLKFALNTFKSGLSYDKDVIYNSLTRLPPHTFDQLLARVNEYASVEDNEAIAIRAHESAKGGGGKFDNSKRKIKEENNKVGENGYKAVNTVFTKPICKIMFDI